MRRTRTPSLLLAAAVALGCVRSDDDDDDHEGQACDMDLQEIRGKILVPNCTGEFCHDADMPTAGIDFTAPPDAIADALIDQPSVICPDWIRVVPGDRENSILFAKLHDPPPCGERMPVDGELSDSDIACIGEWIEHLEPD